MTTTVPAGIDLHGRNFLKELDYTPDEIRPFTALSYQITALWGASRPEGHHALNIALHTANSLIVFAIARTGARLTLAGAAVAGLVFALLPSSAESVAWRKRPEQTPAVVATPAAAPPSPALRSTRSVSCPGWRVSSVASRAKPA